MEVDNICRLCFEICENGFEPAENIQEILRFLLINLDMAVSAVPVVCNNCINNLKKCFDFKINCLCNIDHTSIKYNDTDLKVSEGSLGANKVDILKIFSHDICCSCMAPINGGASVFLTNEDEKVSVMLYKYYPELVLNCTMNSMCSTCYESLQRQLAFLSNCLAIEEKIKEYCEVEKTNSDDQIELSSVLHFMSTNQLQNNIHCSFNGVKVEDSSEEIKNEDKTKVKKGDLIKTEETGISCIKREDIDIEMEIKAEGGDDRLSAFYSMPRNDLPTQRDTMEGTMFNCKVCTYQSRLKKDLASHMLTHKHKKNITVYNCEICTYQTKRKRDVSRHILSHKGPSEIIMHKCTICTYQSKRKDDLQKHMLIHKHPSEITMYKCEICPYQSRHKNSLPVHMLTHKDPSEVTMYKCETCSYQSRHRGNLSVHMLTHKTWSEVLVHKCQVCSYRSKYKYEFSRHMLKHKSSPEVNKQKNSLSSHVPTHKDLSESEVTMHKCKVCTFQSEQESDVSSHMLTHKNLLDVKVYRCDKCAYQSKYKSNLSTHMLTHRSIAEVTMYKCKVCVYQSKRKGDLLNHMLTHKPSSEVAVFRCQMCAFETKHRNSLKRHVLTHCQPKLT